MGEKFSAFWKDFGGFIVGSIFGILAILLNIVDIIVTILVVLLFGMLGSYIQRNKKKVKAIINNLNEKW